MIQRARKSARLDPVKMKPVCGLVAAAAKRAKAPVPVTVAALSLSDFVAVARDHAEWSLFAIKAPATAVAMEFAKLHKISKWSRNVPLKAKRAGQVIARQTAVLQVTGSPWTVVLRSLGEVTADELTTVPREAKTISGKLKTRAIPFLREDTSAASAYSFFDSGKLLENAEREAGGELAAFSSKLRPRPRPRGVESALVAGLLQPEDIHVPACYPCAQGNAVWLAIDPKSKRAVSRADLIKFD